MKLATTTADLRAYGKTAAETISLFEPTGFRFLDYSFYQVVYPASPYITPGDAWKKEIEAALAVSEKTGIRFCQAHAPDGEHFEASEMRDHLLCATKRSIEACAMLGVKNLVVHAAGNASFTNDAFLHKNREFYACFFEDAEKYGVNLLIENSYEQPPPLHYLLTGEGLKELIAYIGHPLVHACWDTGHAHMEGIDQYQSILALGDDLLGVHINDNYGTQDSHTAPFFGSCNFDPVLRGLLDIGYSGAFTFEGSCMMRGRNDWPHFREPWLYRDKTVETLLDVPLHLKQLAVSLMYETGKHMLRQYGCFEY